MGEPALDLTEIIELYKEDARRMVQKMRDAHLRWEEVVQGGAALQELRRLSHQLRGSGRTYGFRTVTRVAKAIESITIKMEKKKWPADDRTRQLLEVMIKRLAAAFEGSVT